MSYNVSFTDEAENDLDRLKDPALESFVIDQIVHLSRAPAALSRRGGLPHLPFQKYEFWDPGHTIYFTVLFQYSRDEQTLIIVGIGIVRY